MKKFLSTIAILGSFAFPAFGEAYGQWYDQDGGVCDDGPGSIQFNEGMIRIVYYGIGLGPFEIIMTSYTVDEVEPGVFIYSGPTTDGLGHRFMIDTVRMGQSDGIETWAIVPCNTPEPQF